MLKSFTRLALIAVASIALNFSVTLPGSIDWIAPVYTRDAEIKPIVSADGHTVTWRMPLEEMIQKDRLNFSIGFSTWSAIFEAQSKPAYSSEN